GHFIVEVEGFLIPASGGVIVALSTNAGVVIGAEQSHGAAVAAVGGFLHPFEGEPGVFGDADAAGVGEADGHEVGSDADLCSAEGEAERLLFVFLSSAPTITPPAAYLAAVIEHGHEFPGVGGVAFGCLDGPVPGLDIILRDSLAGG